MDIVGTTRQADKKGGKDENMKNKTKRTSENSADKKGGKDESMKNKTKRTSENSADTKPVCYASRREDGRDTWFRETRRATRAVTWPTLARVG